VERKEARAHRNRIAAQNSRDRRKAQFCWLERRVSELEEENRRLRAGFLVAPAQPDSPGAEELQKENAELRERIKTLENGWAAVLTALAGGLSTRKAPSASAPASEPPPHSSVFR
jgi:cell division protein FtsB